MTPAPRGLVTFLFSDVEGSTRLLESHPDETGAALARHHEILAKAIRAHSGVIFETVGDAVYAAFQHAPDAARAALAGQRALAQNDWGPVPRLRVRIALHTGEVESRGSHYFGAPLFRCARLQSLAYGDQTLVSEATSSLIRAERPRGVNLRDLGWQRLKDLDDPEHVFQLDADGLPSEFPQLRSLGETKHNLPAEFSSFVGREENLDDLRSRVTRPGVLVIVGPGGVGKTRLAIHLGRELLEQFPDGCYLVELAPLSLASQAFPAIAIVLRLRETPGRSLDQVVSDYLADKHVLVILDNAEHLTDVRASIRELAAAAPLATILVTSRTRLALAGAFHHQLRPLHVGSGAEPAALPGPAVQLLADRINSLDETFRLTAGNTPVLEQICERVDGLALGIELVAPVVAGLGAKETLESLLRRPTLAGDSEETDDRHASLRKTVAWSYGLLGQDARDVFAESSIFVGSFDIVAARAVSTLSPEVTDRGLLTLVDSSLLSPIEGVGNERRFSMMVTVQDFAREILKSRNGADIEAAHAAYFAQLGAEAAEQLQGPNQGDWRSLITLELPNLRAALAWLERQSPEGLLRMVLDLERFWDLSGFNSEGRMWLDQAMAGNQGDPQLTARALRWRGVLAEHHGDLSFAAKTYRQLSALQQQMGDTTGLADTQRGQAGVAAARGRPRDARRLLNQAIAAHRRDGDLRRTADGLHQLALVELESGDVDAALALLPELEDLYQRLGDSSGTAVAKHHYGRALRQTGKYPEAILASNAALAMFEDAGNDGWLPPPLVNLAWAELAMGDTNGARRRTCRALALVQRIDEPFLLPRILEARAAVEAIDGHRDLARRIVRAADAHRHRGHWQRSKADSRELRRYVRTTSRLDRGNGPSATDVDELVRELLAGCNG